MTTKLIPVPVPYTHHELEEKKDEIVLRLAKIEELEFQKKSSADDFKARIGVEEGRIKTLRLHIETGTHTMSRECTLSFDFAAGLRLWVDVETGEVHASEPLQPEDYQVDLDFANEANHKAEEEAEWEDASGNSQLLLTDGVDPDDESN